MGKPRQETKPLTQKTDDPEAKNYDEATDIFLSGVKLARNGDFEAACPQIACAYILDSRSINFTMNQSSPLESGCCQEEYGPGL